MKKISCLFPIILLLTTSACTTVTIIPEDKDTQTIITNAATENESIKIANYHARSICTLKGKKIKITELDTIYQGDNKKQKELIELAKTILPKNKTSGDYTPEDYTYKAKLSFKCI